jgi:hypothetical protein
MGKLLIPILILSAIFWTADVNAEDSWYIKTDFQFLYTAYQDSTLKEGLIGGGPIINISYLEQASITLSYSVTKVSFKNPAIIENYNTTDSSGNAITLQNYELGQEDIEQNSIFLSTSYNIYTDKLGKFITRFDFHSINNDDASGSSDGVIVYAPQLSFLPYSGKYYIDLGLAHSTYPYSGSSTYNSDLTLTQLTPTLGYEFNADNWIQIRAYLISSSDNARSQGKSDFASIEPKWTHWYGKNILGIDNSQLSALIGERLFAVDPDAGAVYNTPDMQTGSISLGMQWKLNESNTLQFNTGLDRYHAKNNNVSIDEDFTGVFLYFDLSKSW